MSDPSKIQYICSIRVVKTEDKPLRIARMKPGPKPTHTSCSECGDKHCAHGLCKRCYMRRYMRSYRLRIAEPVPF